MASLAKLTPTQREALYGRYFQAVTSQLYPPIMNPERKSIYTKVRPRPKKYSLQKYLELLLP